MPYWTYSDWEEQPTPATQLDRLIKWRTELRDAVTQGVTSSGESINASDVRQMLDMTERDMSRLRQQTGANRPIVRTAVTRHRRLGHG